MDKNTAFPLALMDDIKASPDDYRLLSRVPLTLASASFPMQMNPVAGDERPFLVVDVESTGLDTQADKIIELGMVRGQYSPSQGRITSISGALSRFEDPGVPISEEITQITGITDEDVAGQAFDEQEVAQWFAGDPLVIAHNASFDRPMMDRRFPAFAKAGWGCTVSEIDWKALGYEARKLEYLLFKHGYFYEGHRAAIDCLATAWLLHVNPDAFGHLLASVRQPTITIKAFGAPFDVKDTLKARGYRWHGGDAGSNKCWWTTVAEKDLDAEQAFLDATYHNGAGSAAYTKQTARTRFKGDVD